MKLFSRSSLRTRLLLLTALAMVPFLILICFDYYSEYQRESAALEQDVLRFAEFVSGDIEQLLETCREILGSLVVVYHEASPDVRDKLFAGIFRQTVFIADVGVVTPGGRVLCAFTPDTNAVELVDDRLLRRAAETQEMAVGAFRVHYLGNRDVLTVAYQPPLGERTVSPVIAFAILDVGWLDHLLSEERVTGRMSLFPQEMVLNIVDRSGAVLSRHPDREKWAGRSILDTPLLKAALERGEGTVDATGVDGIQRFYAFSAVKGSSGDLFVNVGVSKQDALIPARHDLHRNLAALLAIGIGIFSAVWIGAGVLVARPVTALIAATRGLRDGDLDARAQLATGPREIVSLANSFDEMAESLQRYDLERKEAHAKLTAYDRQLRNMTVDLSLAEEQERKQIAAALHDSVGPLLAVT